MNQTALPVMGVGSTATNKNKILCLIVISFLCAGVLLHQRAVRADTAAVTEWLRRHNLGYINDVVVQAGGTSLAGALSVVKNIQRNRKLSKSLSNEQHILLERAVDRLRDEQEFEMWLQQNGFSYCTELLKKNGIDSLHKLSQQGEDELHDMLEQGGLHGDDQVFFSSIIRLRLDLASGHRLFHSKAVLAHAQAKSKHSSFRILCE
ncbi:hypothetical protein PoB_004084200 [Plakobranchus ocellatus]|uniref:SAM domain-containing protein n=1 Tax=Plakobranchus ocellatus TaxID=259542 RepID=A0AAV4B577_9GAST|nr:hypothetical protein PoB_004084200 [Plakobranchus ocellatus]